MDQPNYDILDDAHPLAGQPLHAIGAEMRNKRAPDWRQASTLLVARTSYKDLRGPWKECNEFRVPRRTSNEQT